MRNKGWLTFGFKIILSTSKHLLLEVHTCSCCCPGLPGSPQLHCNLKVSCVIQRWPCQSPLSSCEPQKLSVPIKHHPNLSNQIHLDSNPTLDIIMLTQHCKMLQFKKIAIINYVLTVQRKQIIQIILCARFLLCRFSTPNYVLTLLHLCIKPKIKLNLF